MIKTFKCVYIHVFRVILNKNPEWSAVEDEREPVNYPKNRSIKGKT